MQGDEFATQIVHNVYPRSAVLIFVQPNVGIKLLTGLGEISRSHKKVSDPKFLYMHEVAMIFISFAFREIPSPVMNGF